MFMEPQGELHKNIKQGNDEGMTSYSVNPISISVSFLQYQYFFIFTLL